MCHATRRACRDELSVEEVARQRGRRYTCHTRRLKGFCVEELRFSARSRAESVGVANPQCQVGGARRHNVADLVVRARLVVALAGWPVCRHLRDAVAKQRGEQSRIRDELLGTCELLVAADAPLVQLVIKADDRGARDYGAHTFHRSPSRWASTRGNKSTKRSG